MIKKLLLILTLCATILNAASFNQRVANIIGFNEFNENRGLINHIFSDKKTYYVNGTLNYLSVMQKLKDNGLLKVGLRTPQDISIIFKISDAPVKSMKIIADSLKVLGYYHYFTKNLVYDKTGGITWVMTLKTEAAIDPLMLSRELAKNSCRFLDIKKEGNTKWMYTIDTSNATLAKATKLIVGEKVDFRKPLKPYFIDFEIGSNLTILSKIGNQWFPNIVFYDKDLNILEIVKEGNEKQTSVSVAIPENTKYVKIDDVYTLDNIKRGLSVIIKE